MIPPTAPGMLAVFVGDKRFGFSDPESFLDLRWLTKPVRLDLYLADDTWGPLTAGKRWRVQTSVSNVVARSDWLTLPAG